MTPVKGPRIGFRDVVACELDSLCCVRISQISCADIKVIETYLIMSWRLLYCMTDEIGDRTASCAEPKSLAPEES